jgi:valyl-tRNA synthetase
LSPVRGLDQPLDASLLLIAAGWPETRPDREADEIERRFDQVRDVIRGIRELRARYNIPPGREMEAVIKAFGPSSAVLEAHRNLLIHMGRLSGLTISDSAERPATAGTQVVGDVEIYLAGAVDPDKEKAKLTKQREKLVKDIRNAETRLQNGNFVSKAPARVVEAERQKLADLQAQLKLVDANMEALD